MTEYERFNRSKFHPLAISWFMAIFFILMAVSSCKEKESPQNILSPTDMVKILGELYIAEEKINKLSVSRDSGNAVFNYMDDKVFEKLGTTDSVFKQSLNYYLERPEEIEKIYAAVIDSLNLREQRLPQP